MLHNQTFTINVWAVLVQPRTLTRTSIYVRGICTLKWLLIKCKYNIHVFAYLLLAFLLCLDEVLCQYLQCTMFLNYNTPGNNLKFVVSWKSHNICYVGNYGLHCQSLTLNEFIKFTLHVSPLRETGISNFRQCLWALLCSSFDKCYDR